MTVMPKEMEELVLSIKELSQDETLSRPERQSALRAVRLIKGLYKNDSLSMEEGRLDR